MYLNETKKSLNVCHLSSNLQKYPFFTSSYHEIVKKRNTIKGSYLCVKESLLGIYDSQQVLLKSSESF